MSQYVSRFAGPGGAAQAPASRRPPQTAPGGHAQRAHLPAAPAGDGRRGRHERVHRRARQAARRDQHRGRDLHAGHHRRARADGGDVARRTGAAHRRGSVRGPREGGTAGPAVRFHARGDAGVGGAPARPLRPGPLPLLALRPRRLARRRALGRAARPRHAHHGQGQERGARRGRHPRARRARHRRDADRERGGPAHREHRRGGRRTRPLLRSRPRQGRRRPPRGEPGPVPPGGRKDGGAGPARAAPGRVHPRLRGPHPAAEGPRHTAARGGGPAGAGPFAALADDRADRGRPERQRPGEAGGTPEAGGPARHQ